MYPSKAVVNDSVPPARNANMRDYRHDQPRASRTNLRLTLLLTLLVASFSSARAADVRILLDVDHDQTTGCVVFTTGGTVHGVDQIVTTTWDPASSTVTSVTQQKCL